MNLSSFNDLTTYSVGKKWLFWFCEGSACVSDKTKCAICAADVFILCLFVIFITVVVFLE